MTRKRAEFLTGYEIRTSMAANGRVRVAAFADDQLIAQTAQLTERLALKALVESVYRLHCGKILKEYGGCCSRCRQNAHHVHHKRYRSHGGTHQVENLEPVCWDCHRMIHEIEHSQ